MSYIYICIYVINVNTTIILHTLITQLFYKWRVNEQKGGEFLFLLKGLEHQRIFKTKIFH